MSLSRILIATVAAFAFATSVFAADDASTQNPADTTTTTQTTTTTTTSEAATQVNINTATVEELAKVHGLNKSQATKIVKYRESHGNYNSVDDLKNVKGLNARQLKKIKNQLTVG